jgi:hypothetical protein
MLALPAYRYRADGPAAEELAVDDSLLATEQEKNRLMGIEQSGNGA